MEGRITGKKMLRACKFRICPDAGQRELFAKTFGSCRFLYNHMLSDKIGEYKKSGQLLRTTPAGYKKEYPWLKEVDSLALANVQLHLECAYRNFFENPKSGFPRYKAKHHSRQSYTTNVVNGNIRIEEGRYIRLPKAGKVKIRIHRGIPGDWKLKSVTVSMEPSGKYYASLLYESNVGENQTDKLTAGRDTQRTEGSKAGGEMRILGIDFAMHGLAVFSDGSRADYPMYYRQAQERLAREQRKLSHCVPGSKNYGKQKKRVARFHEKIRNQRKDFQHKLSRRIADSYDAVAVEDIDMKAMSQSLHFGKSVMDNGNGAFRNMLRYKLEEQGKELIVVDRFYPSSKRCSICGNVKKELRLNERIYRCSCGNCIDRDVNAAVNIREEGRRLLTA